MKLYYSSTSPYSRKVRLTIREKGVESQVTEITVNPLAKDNENTNKLYESDDSKIAVAPKTMAWYAEFSTSPAMQATQLIDLST